METRYYKELKFYLLTVKLKKHRRIQFRIIVIIAIITIVAITYFEISHGINSKTLAIGILQMLLLWFIILQFILDQILPFGNIYVTDREIRKEIRDLLALKEALKDKTEDLLILEKEINILKESLV